MNTTYRRTIKVKPIDVKDNTYIKGAAKGMRYFARSKLFRS